AGPQTEARSEGQGAARVPGLEGRHAPVHAPGREGLGRLPPGGDVQVLSPSSHEEARDEETILRDVEGPAVARPGTRSLSDAVRDRDELPAVEPVPRADDVP